VPSTHYRVRESKRARQVSLRVMPPDGAVEVVVPVGQDHTVAALVVEQHHDWIVRQQQKMAGLHHITSTPQRQLPTEIDLVAIGCSLHVIYQSVESLHSIATMYNASTMHLFVTGDLSKTSLIFDGLHTFLKQFGKSVLPQMVWRLVAQHESICTFNPQRITVRLQQSRWGSCSERGNISLNAKLLLLPLHLVDHVILHELAHLQVADHSPKYWSFLSRIDPCWEQHKAELRQHEATMPSWVSKG